MEQRLHIRVLGCSGGEMAGYLAPSLLFDGGVLLDAGSFGSVLSLAEQLRIDHVLLSHAHCDHVKDLAGFADLIIGRRKQPVLIHAAPEAMRVLRGDLFNNRLWPDFFSLPSPAAPVLKEAVFSPGRAFRVGPLRVKAIPVTHPVETMGFIIRTPSGSLVYTGDTGPTERLWREANRLRDLRLLLMECKFPNELQAVADAAGHLTPDTLNAELRKIRARHVPIWLYHIKPDCQREVIRELRRLRDPRLHILRAGTRIWI
ncbi:MAG: 3',5'-cyclic-nucleotide phosphodiesterase [Myxococcales bacterium]|nr:3',5'-cyclic-nucleotide phosphodiesterase [Myxococcales bacterium]